MTAHAADRNGLELTSVSDSLNKDAMMFRYNANTEDHPRIGDNVTICNTVSDMDGITGVVGGWVDYAKMAAIVILTAPYRYPEARDAVLAVSMPVVCLTKNAGHDTLYSNPAPSSYFESIRAARDNMSPVGDMDYEV